MNSSEKPKIYNLPAGIPFADALAHKLLCDTAGNETQLTKYKILLPTRRACRNLRDSFLRLSNGKPLLLPQMQPIGDVDEDNLDIGSAGLSNKFGEDQLNLPPAIPALKRKLMLARMILAMEDFSNNAEKAIALADGLGRLMDQIHTENLSLDDLPTIVADKELAKHWEVTVDFLQILSRYWPQILAEQGMIDAADRRNRLVLALADYWETNPPQTPVIAAGSTGSIPATSRLLSVISKLPQGQIILPGLNTDIDPQSWDAIDDTHPQATLKNIITNEFDIKIENISDNVAIYDYSDELITKDYEPLALTKAKIEAKRKFFSEVMRPASTSKEWIKLSNIRNEEKSKIKDAISDIRITECDTQQEEALIIAMHLRAALEQPEKRAIVITPDRNLARRIAVICKRWDIHIDDSAGYPLSDSLIGGTMIQTAKMCLSNYQTGQLASFLKQHLTFIPAELKPHIADFETHILRGQKISDGLSTLRKRAQEKHSLLTQRGSTAFDLGAIENIIDLIEAKTSRFHDLCDGKKHPFIEFIDEHIRMTESIATDTNQTIVNKDDIPQSQIWAGDDGEAAALFLADLRQHAYNMPHISADDYIAIWDNLARTVTVRSTYGMHPRLAILGQLEARLVHADLIILAGLNEGTWPPEPATDPWMSRPMRKTYGLPSPERGIGLSAHDFTQACCHPNVIITRSKRLDGTPTTPARWLQRMDTVLAAYGFDPQIMRDTAILQTARQLDHTGEAAKPVLRPAPTPPANKRPNHLYVTAIEKWMRDPYSIYARYILGLRKIDDLEEDINTAIRGTILHEILESFVSKYPKKLPTNAKDEFLELSNQKLHEHIHDRNLINFWWPRIQRFADWYLPFEQNWRDYKGMPLTTEISGHTTLQLNTGSGFKLSAKADRIDRTHEGTLAIIDYKSGNIPTSKDIESGYTPQITATGFIASQGGFEQIDDGAKQDITYLGFWPISGSSSSPNTDKTVKNDAIEQLIDEAANGITKLAEIFSDPQVPYYSLPRLDKALPKNWQDYAHLARVAEWAALGEQEDAA